ncbi:uncharacterized protein METZ01_LOCUS174832, partial [marine metagenome]
PNSGQCNDYHIYCIKKTPRFIAQDFETKGPYQNCYQHQNSDSEKP